MPKAREEDPEIANIRSKLDAQEKGLAGQKDQDKWMALLQGSLGTLAGTSQYALQNIGAGGLKGVAALAEANKERNAQEKEILAQRLGLQKMKTADEIQREQNAITREHYGNTYTLGMANNATEQARLSELIRQHGAEMGYKYFAEEQNNNYKNNYLTMVDKQRTDALNQAKDLKVPQTLEAMRKNVTNEVLNRRKIGMEAMDDPATKNSVNQEVDEALSKGPYAKMYKDYMNVDFTPTPYGKPNSQNYVDQYGLNPSKPKP